MERKLTMKRSCGMGARCARTPGGVAFSLIELITVMAIMSILIAVTVPAVSSLQGSMQMTSAGASVGDFLSLARQTAVSSDRDVAVRFYQPASGGPLIGCQAFILQDNGTQTAVQRVLWLPQRVVFSDNTNQSSLFQTISGTATVSGQQTLKYSQFCFLRDGSTDLDPSASWFFTLTSPQAATNSTTNTPSNFVTFLIEPENGTVKYYRP